ncbi:MAG TPA: LuxR C-terminal-related transcriptional regulator [Tepidiformaceae bacterium]|nr:LuxR C-terminal-related transcriptional regulator [Tepidiformaceae bacterium]
MRSGTPIRTRLNELTDTQRRVLALIAEGRTNYEIGQELGITLDGAKYHVSEILNKLGLDTREEAADWWRREQRRPAAKVSRAMALPAAKWVLGGTAAAVAVVVAVVLLAAFRKDDPPAAPHIQAAFLVGDDQAAPRKIIIVDDEGNQRQIGEERRYVAVDWAPDGRKLFAMAVDGDNLTAWTFDSTSGDSSSWPLEQLLQWWKWSPDGGSLALLFTDRLAIVRPDGGQVATLTLPPATEHSNSGWPLLWSPDSSWVAATDRDVLAVLNTSGEGDVLDLPPDFAGKNVVLTAWVSTREVQITDPAYAGRPQSDAKAWLADVTTAPIQWRVGPYTAPAPPSDAENDEARSLAGAGDEPWRASYTEDGGAMFYTFYSARTGVQGPVVIAVVVRSGSQLRTLPVPGPVLRRSAGGEMSVVVVDDDR